jgi:hypothetical protein
MIRALSRIDILTVLYPSRHHYPGRRSAACLLGPDRTQKAKAVSSAHRVPPQGSILVQPS